jgi:hypothetical protein
MAWNKPEHADVDEPLFKISIPIATLTTHNTMIKGAYKEEKSKDRKSMV